MTDDTHYLLAKRIFELHRKLLSLEVDLFTLKDAFWEHTHAEEKP